jgi:nitrous oxidase accessory protein NosD
MHLVGAVVHTATAGVVAGTTRSASPWRRIVVTAAAAMQSVTRRGIRLRLAADVGRQEQRAGGATVTAPRRTIRGLHQPLARRRGLRGAAHVDRS